MHASKLKLTLIVGLFFLPTAAPSRAAVVTAVSCSQADVQAAIDQARDGDTVLLPEGSASWRTLSPNTPAVTLDQKAITFQGAGIDKTVIRDETGDNYNEFLLLVETVAGKPFRITGITLKNNHYALTVSGTAKDWRIDHCAFEGGNTAVWTSGNTYGVIDHCTVRMARILIDDDNEGSWARPLSPGSADAVFIEDCTLDHTNPDNLQGQILDGGDGGRMVFRYNRVINASAGNHGRDSGRARSTFSNEIYGNKFNTTQSHYRGLYLRGGTGVIFFNRFQGPYAHFHLTNYCSCFDNTPGRCTFDQCLSYPCIDQIGRATLQTLEPIYEWENTINGNNMQLTVSDFSPCQTVSEHIKINRDYYNDTIRHGYLPYEYPHPVAAAGETGRRLGLQGKETVTGTAELTWQAITNAAAYHIRRDWAAPVVLNAAVLNYIDPQAARLYLVDAVSTDGTVLASQGVRVKKETDLEAPGRPVNLKAVAVSAKQINLTWNASTDNVGVVGYRVYRNGLHVANPFDTAIEDSALLPSTSYIYTVTAYDEARNESPKSEEITAVTPATQDSGGSSTSGGGGGGGGCFIESAIRGLETDKTGRKVTSGDYIDDTITISTNKKTKGELGVVR